MKNLPKIVEIRVTLQKHLKKNMHGSNTSLFEEDEHDDDEKLYQVKKLNQ